MQIYKSRSMHFMLVVTISEILKFQIVYFKKVGQGHGQFFFAMLYFNGEYRNLQT